jgi:hypothetical protein
MLLKDLPNRILTARAYRIVGATIHTNAEQLRQELSSTKEKLPEKLDTSLQKLEASSQELATLLSGDVTIGELDQDTDHVIASTRQLFSSWVEALDDTDYLPLSTALETKRRHLEALSQALFPDGTKFLTKPPKEQWTHLDDMRRAIETPEVQTNLAACGLTEEAKWLVQWITLYGDKVGITDATATNKLIQLQEKKLSFQDALDKLKVQVFSAYDDDKSELHLKHRVALLGPYVEQVETARATDRKIRQARAEKATKAAAEKAAKEAAEKPKES